MFNNLRNDKILLVSSSIGFRAPSPVGTRFLPFRLKTFNLRRTPWALDYYSTNCVRLYRTGFTILDFLVYLDRYNIELDEFKYAIFNFAVVEGWLRDNFDDSDDGDSSWFPIIDRLLKETEGTKYHAIMADYKNRVIKNKLPKTILSAEIFRDLILELCMKIKNIEKVIFITFDDSMYKKYTQESINSFNKIIFDLSINKDFEILNFNNLELFDGVHLNYKGHFDVSSAIKETLALNKNELSTLSKFLFSIKEYLKFRKYNLDNFFDCSVKKDISNKILRGLKR